MLRKETKHKRFPSYSFNFLCSYIFINICLIFLQLFSYHFSFLWKNRCYTLREIRVSSDKSRFHNTRKFHIFSLTLQQNSWIFLQHDHRSHHHSKCIRMSKEKCPVLYMNYEVHLTIVQCRYIILCLKLYLYSVWKKNAYIFRILMWNIMQATTVWLSPHKRVILEDISP
jgi:hypothetical protein